MKKIVFIIGCLTLLFFTGCKKELSDNFSTYTNHPLNDTIWSRNVSAGASVHEIMGLLVPAIIIDSFEVTRDTTLKYGDSLEISFTGGSCIGTGTATPTGKVKLEILRLQTKGDYIKAFKPTTSSNYLLETGGAFFIRVSKEGKELSLAPGTTVKIRFSDTQDPKNNLQVFYGKENTPLPVSGIDTAFTWLRDTDTSYLKTFQKPTNSQQSVFVKGYEIISKNLRWVSAQRYIDSTRPKAKITAILPPNFTNKNTAVFAVFTDQKTIVKLSADFASRSFAAGNIPLNSKIKIISISRIADAVYLGTKDINDAGITVAYSIKPEKKSLKDLVGFLNGL